MMKFTSNLNFQAQNHETIMNSAWRKFNETNITNFTPILESISAVSSIALSLSLTTLTNGKSTESTISLGSVDDANNNYNNYNLTTLNQTSTLSILHSNISTWLKSGMTSMYYNDSQNNYHSSNNLNNNSNNNNETNGMKFWNEEIICDNGDDTSNEENDSGWYSSYFKTAVYLLYISIFLFALIGNGIVCYIVQSTPRMRTVTNYFIANLAVGDILMSLFCVPFSFVSIFILRFWPFGIVLCHLVNYSQAVSVLVSAYTLVAISVDRYIAIMWPLRPRITKRYAKCIIAVVWFIALMTALPILLVSKLKKPEGWHTVCEKYICYEEWPSAEQNYYYTLALLTSQFVIPLAVLIFTYTRIAIAVWGKRPPGEAENSRDQRMARSKRKMIKMMVTVVIVFTICWLPFNILVLLLNDENFVQWDPLPYFWFAFHWLAMSHSCYNPIIYCYMNARFRGGFLQIVHRIPGLRHCWCVRKCARGRSSSMAANFQLTGIDDTFHLQRVNTCTTYVSTRRKPKSNVTQTSQYSCAETTLLR